MAEIKDLMKVLDKAGKNADYFLAASQGHAEEAKRRNEITMEWLARKAEQDQAPVVIRNAMVALLNETRSNAHRERWILGATFASVILSGASLAVALIVAL